MKKISVRPLGWLAVVVAAGLLVLWLRPQPMPVETATVSRGPLAVTLEEEGVTRIHPRHVVAAPASGRFSPAPLREGDRLTEGQTLGWLAAATLDPRTRAQAEAALRTAEASLAEAKARIAEALVQREHARRELARHEKLRLSGHQAASLVDDARAAESAAARSHEAAVHHGEAAAFQVENARAALVSGDPARPGTRLAVTSPAEAVLLRRFEESERVVAAGTPLVEMGRLEDLEIVVDVLTTDTPLVVPGAEMLVSVGRPEPLRAHVVRVEPAAFTKVSPLGVEEQRVNVVAKLDAPDPALGDRFRVEARIVVWRGAEVVKVPAGAVFRRASGWGTYAVAKGRAVLRSIEVGHRNPDEVEVTKGLSSGEVVVAYPPDGLVDGARVAPVAARR